MDLNEFLGPKPTVTWLQARERFGAIEELLNALVAQGKVPQNLRDAALAALKKRESAMSTGIGHGFALPHAAVDQINEVIIAVGCSPTGIDFQSLDGKSVDLVILYLVPGGRMNRHLHTLANIAKLAHSPDIRSDLRKRYLVEG